MAEITNWYDKIGANAKKKKMPKKWKDHHIHHNSMILCIGETGTGKTNSLIDYLSRCSGEYHKIMICSFSTLDEPLYNFLIIVICRAAPLKGRTANAGHGLSAC